MDVPPGLFPIDSVEAENVSKDALRKGAFLCRLTTRKASDRSSFFDAVRAAMPLDPPVYGSNNWNALSDSILGGIEQIVNDTIVIVWTDSVHYRRVDSEGFDIAIEVLRNVVNLLDDWTVTNGEPKKVFIYVA